VLAGEPTEALRHADEALRTLADGEAPPALLALLHRVRGYALLQLGDPDGAEQCLDESIRVAREGDSSYELALSLGAAARLRERTSGNDEGKSSEAARLLESLGVVSVPEVPLPPVGR
jgi:tetratricopeptide (TPR) repeat protein